MRNGQRILLTSIAFIGVIITDIFVFYITQSQAVTFVPLIFGALLVLIVPPSVSLGIVLSYVCFDGILKIL
jgi:hypothetical protein